MTKVLALLLCLLPVLMTGHEIREAQQESLVFVHVTVIDVASGAAKPDMTVVVTGNKIAEVGKSETVPTASHARIVDGTGKFLIPGLWDMHVHWYNLDYNQLFTANGVTGVRQMFGNPDLLRWRHDIEKGSLLGPRMVVASPIVDGPQPVWPTSIAVKNEAEGRNAVKRVKKEGYDFVKVYSLLPRDAYFGIVDEAKKEGINFAGHVPFTVSAGEASDAGQKTIEHLTGIIINCSSKESEIRRQVIQGGPPQRGRIEAEALQSYDTAKAQALFAKFIKNGTWQCPTLTVLRSTASLGDSDFRNDPRLGYMPPQVRQRWETRADSRVGNAPFARRVYQKEIEIVGAMNKAGVPILAGTDTGNPYCFPGFSLHDELALLVQAGLTPAEALRAATLSPAKFLGLEGLLGTIEKNKLADMVLLDANPLDNIRNTMKISAVVMNGRLLDRKALDKMLR
jgi:hypothetical protein